MKFIPKQSHTAKIDFMVRWGDDPCHREDLDTAIYRRAASLEACRRNRRCVRRRFEAGHLKLHS